MRRLILVALLLLAGCQSLMGPRKRALAPEKVDPAGLPIKEQEYRGRDRLALPDPQPWVGPRTGAEIPAQLYGQTSH